MTSRPMTTGRPQGIVPGRASPRNPTISPVPTRSYWLDRPLSPLRLGRRAGTVDVIVVGGGVTGTACTLALATRGARVRLLEAGEVACGASGPQRWIRGLRHRPAVRRAVQQPRRRGGATPLGAGASRALERIAALAGDTFRGSAACASPPTPPSSSRCATRRPCSARDGFDPGREEALAPPLDAVYTSSILVRSGGAIDPVHFVRGAPRRGRSRREPSRCRAPAGALRRTRTARLPRARPPRRTGTPRRCCPSSRPP